MTQSKNKTQTKTEKTDPASSVTSLIAKSAEVDDLVIRHDGGDLLIREHVVGKIAGLAVREVAGVHGLVPFSTTESIEALAKKVTGGSKRDLGVRVEIGKVECAVDCRLVLKYGVSIPEVAQEVRAIVAERVGITTGLQVREVNIEVTDLYFDDAKAAPAEMPARQLR